MSAERYRLAIVDALSLVGRELRSRLERTTLPLGEVLLLDRAENVGTLTEIEGEPAVVQELTPAALEALDGIILCGRAELVAPHLDRLLADGVDIVDLTGGLGDEEHPAQLWRVGGDLERGVAPVRVPDAVSMVLAQLLGAVRTVAAVRQFRALALLPAAEQGERGIDELHAQTVATLNFRSAPTDVLGDRLAFDLRPLVGAEEERRIATVRSELDVLLQGRPDGDIAFLRVPVFLGLALRLELSLKAELAPKDLAGALATAGIELDEDAPPTPGDLQADTADRLRVADLTPASTDRRQLTLWAVADLVGYGQAAAGTALLTELCRQRLD